ncbi:MAG TPA: hypothetical protein DF383_11140 [Deltaproteobacteria bacterium]|nr:hypothetical protein [Deltaproteobacteria bacterium]
MKKSFREILNQALRKKGYASLSTLYEGRSFSFTYEYLRKIFSGERIPQVKKIPELAAALGLEAAFLEEQASAARLEKKIQRHYGLPAPAKLGNFGDKIDRFKQEGKIEAKIWNLLQKLGEEEKRETLRYVQFLWNQCRAKRKNPGN